MPSGSVATECSHNNDGQRSHQRILHKEQAKNAQIEGILLQVHFLLQFTLKPLLFFPGLQLENTKLHEQIAEFKFVLDQNATIIQRLKRDNDSKSILILQLQKGKGKSIYLNYSCINQDHTNNGIHFYYFR